MKVLIDLFCGAGGFSEGGHLAGFDKIIAVDCWETALQVHKMNHPESICLQMTLGRDYEKTFDTIMRNIPKFDPKKDIVHCHASPPCQNLSVANVEKDTGTGMTLVKWTFNFLKCYFHAKHTWTLEQVYNKALVDYAEKRKKTDMKMWFDKVDMSLHAVPQCRRRFVACNRDIFASLPHYTTVMSDYITVPKGTYLLGNTFCNKRKLEANKETADHVKRYEEGKTQSYTITSKPMYFVGKDYKVIRSFTVHDNARLQTFCMQSADNFSSIPRKQEALTMVGNSVPPVFAKVLLETLLSL
jgi:site-specific DNA-cytosine methylase